MLPLAPYFLILLINMKLKGVSSLNSLMARVKRMSSDKQMAYYTFLEYWAMRSSKRLLLLMVTLRIAGKDSEKTPK